MERIKRFEPLFGSWYAEELIGAGSFGRVYKAKKEEYSGIFYSAIKHFSVPQDEVEIVALRQEGNTEESISHYFTEMVISITEEIRMMSQLRGNSNIISYEDSCVIPKESGAGYDVFIRMELLTSLTKLIEERSLTREEVVCLGIDICKALQVCHKKGIIHRDIKPENLFINDEGDFKLGDFGVSRQIEKSVGFMSKKGTYNYMAPEVYRGEAYGKSIDLYSLGIVLYRLLNNGRLPFLPPYPERITPIDREESLMKRMRGDLVPLPQQAQDDLGQIVLRACAFNPKDRFATAGEMRDALHAISQSHKTNTIPVFVTAPIPPDETENNQTNVLIGAQPIKKTENVDEDSTVSLFNDRPTPTVTPEPPPISIPQVKTSPEKKKKRRAWPIVLLSIVVAIAIVATIILLTNCPQKKPISDASSVTTASLTATSTPTQTAKPSPTPTQTAKPSPTPYQEVYGEWSSWSTQEIETSDSRQVETGTEYRYMDKSTKTVTEKISGWTLDKTEKKWNDYGAWSDWSSSQVAKTESRDVESKAQSRYRTITTSQKLSDWGEWSKWSTTAVTAGTNCQVETKTTYEYYYYTCANCGKQWHGFAFECYTTHGGCGYYMSTANGLTVLWLDTPYTDSGIKSYWAGSYYFDTYYFGRVYTHKNVSPRTEYRSRTRTLETVTSYSSWSNWGDIVYSATATREVEYRTVYRYRERTQATYYTYSKWSDWSSWSMEKVDESAKRKVETRTVYRYRDKIK